MKFCFVILHYKTEEDTIECVESISKLNYNYNYNIVIVDNASNNGSIEHIEKRYKSRVDIIIIKNKENLGFANGNNIGYQYAKNELNADFIAICNNDIILNTNNFISRVKEIYDDTGFYVAGPDIESLIDHQHQSPMQSTISKINIIKKEIWRYRLLYILSRLNIYDLIKRKSRKKVKESNKKTEFNKQKENCVLHGAFVIFSPKFIKNEEYSFRPGTFLYMEEFILYRYCMNKKYKIIYSPFVKVFHKEDSSTNSLFKFSKDKREFVFCNMIKSLKVYCNILKQK